MEWLEWEGTLEGVGLVTLRRIAEMMREHYEGHVEGVVRLAPKIQRLCQAEL